MSALFKDRKPVTLEFPRRTVPTINPDLPPSNALARKPIGKATDICGIRPVAFVLQQSSGRLFREWKNGKRMRTMARNYRARVNEIEDILRRAA